MSATNVIPTLEQLLDVIKNQQKIAVDDFKKSQPSFEKKIDDLFSISASTNLKNITAQLAKLVMDYAETPQYAKKIIPSIMDTVKHIQITLKNYNNTKRYPQLYFYDLRALRKQYEDLKQLCNKKIWELIVIAGLTTQVSKSSLSILANDGIAFGLGSGGNLV